jgi:transposase InsO family protein
MGQPKSSQRYEVKSSQRYEVRKAHRDRGLVERMIELSRENPHYGYRRVWAMLRGEGWRVNKKRVHRLWRSEGMKVPDEQRKRRRLVEGTSKNGFADLLGAKVLVEDYRGHYNHHRHTAHGLPDTGRVCGGR